MNEVKIYGTIVDKESDWSGDVTGLDGFSEKLNTEEEATIRINSGGGDFYAGLTMAGQIKQMEPHTVAIIEGLCASAATLPAVSADETWAVPGALFMIHECSGYVQGPAKVDDLKKEVRYSEAINRSMAEIYHAKTGIEVDKLLKMMKKETWMTAEEAAELGFVDKVMEGEAPKMAASADRTMLLANGVHIDVSALELPDSVPTNKRIHSAAKADENNEPPTMAGKGSDKPMTLDELKEQAPELVEQIEAAAIERFKAELDDEQEKALEQVKADAEQAQADAVSAALDDEQEKALEQVKADAEQAQADAVSAALDAERARLKAIDETVEHCHVDAAVLNEAKYVKCLTAEQFGYQLWMSDKEKRAAHLDTMRADLQTANALGADPHGAEDAPAKGDEEDPYDYGQRMMAENNH